MKVYKYGITLGLLTERLENSFTFGNILFSSPLFYLYISHVDIF